MSEHVEIGSICWAGGGAQSDEQISFGFVLDVRSPQVAESLCAKVVANTPTNVRVELLLLDDHTNSQRRKTVEVVDGHGDSVRLVPRPADALACLDAASLSSCSEFLVVPLGDDPPLEGLAEASRQLIADGSDVVAIMAEAPTQPQNCDPLADLLGLSRIPRGDRVVMIRRWVARWLFSDVDRDVELDMEIADRARLLGLRTLVLDRCGLPIG